MSDRQSKSAPVRKQKDKKVTTIKEIHSWVHKGNADQTNRKTARHTGLLTENVTEERMLFAKQIELGRERYKFLTNHAYEKQKFIERQKRKQRRLNSSMLGSGKDLLGKRSLTVRIPQVDEFSQSSGLNDEDNTNKVGRDTPSGGNEKTTVSSDEVHLPKTIISPRRPKSMNRGVYLDSSTSANVKPYKVAEKLPAVTVKYDPESVPQTPRISFAEEPYSPVHNGYDTPIQKRQASPAVATSFDMNSLKSTVHSSLKWARKRRISRRIRYGERFPSSCDDPRYVALEESLIPIELDETKRLDDVSDIIRKHEILRRDSKTLRHISAKHNHQKFLAFLLQKELAIS